MGRVLWLMLCGLASVAGDTEALTESAKVMPQMVGTNNTVILEDGQMPSELDNQLDANETEFGVDAEEPVMFVGRSRSSARSSYSRSRISYSRSRISYSRPRSYNSRRRYYNGGVVIVTSRRRYYYNSRRRYRSVVVVGSGMCGGMRSHEAESCRCVATKCNIQRCAGNVQCGAVLQCILLDVKLNEAGVDKQGQPNNGHSLNVRHDCMGHLGHVLNDVTTATAQCWGQCEQEHPPTSPTDSCQDIDRSCSEQFGSRAERDFYCHGGYNIDIGGHFGAVATLCKRTCGGCGTPTPQPTPPRRDNMLDETPSQVFPALTGFAAGAGVAGMAMAFRRRSTPLEEPLTA